ncbi:hypothetical protein JW796_00745 [Candidatus Dojkabacteria bacterium]|nr:hypothetical protein [Candidatus Dojkabacteria bacterium]
MTSKEIRKAFIGFWTEEPRNFQVVPNMSLVPNVDSTLLFVNSGMFPLAPYLAGQPHPLGKRLCNIQRCLRTNYDEMIEIGDNRHTLMFEMMGNWSLGDFTKEQQIEWIMELHIERYKLDPKRLYISVFGGDEDAPGDEVAIKSWKNAFKKYGVDAEFSEDITDIPKNLEEGKNWKNRIFPYPKTKNWWERAHAVGELGGSSSEMFYDRGVIEIEQDKYHINDDSGRFIEIGNNVFMEYKLDKNMKWQILDQKNIDFGGGFERVTMIVQGKNDIFETDIYGTIIGKIEEISGKKYKTNGKDNEFTESFRVIADHIRAAVFILADGIKPSNKDQGYILRRFIRRMVRFAKKIGIERDFGKEVAEEVVKALNYAYPHLKENEITVLEEIEKEERVFKHTLSKGLKEFGTIITSPGEISKNGKPFNKTMVEPELIELGQLLFYFYETYGFPFELGIEEFQNVRNFQLGDLHFRIVEDAFKKEEEKHREASRKGAEQKFKGGLADHSEEVVRLHTAHHLLLASLQKIVNPCIKQRGSNITGERLRMDFNFDRKLTDDEIKRVEALVNEKIEEGLIVRRLTMHKGIAEKAGAQMEFGIKYPDLVTVYTTVDTEINERINRFFNEEGDAKTGNLLAKDVTALLEKTFSKEFCGGPHVKNTKELGKSGKFKILKEENIGSGNRRIKATLAK